MNKLATYLSFVRFSHSVFALPFALTGALLAWREQPFSWIQVAWIVVCMVSARSAAMGFNRLVDAKMDALNPRTAMRELPRGLLSKPEADGVRDRDRRRCSCLRHRDSRTLCLVLVAGRAGDRVLVLACQAVHDLHADVSRPLARRCSCRWMAGRGRSRRRRAVAARPGHRIVGRRFRHSVCLPGCGLRPQAWSALDPGDVRRPGIDSSVTRHAPGHRDRDGVPAGRQRVSRRSILSASRSWPRCSHTSSRSSAIEDLSQVKKAFDLNGWVGIVYFAATALAVYVG